MKTSEKIFWILCGSVLMCWSNLEIVCAQQSAGQLFEKALYAEEVKGDIQEALELYQQVLDENPDNRQLGAKALLHKGICYEKMGSQQARQAYQEVINKYTEQSEEADLAREHISRLDIHLAELNREAEEHIKQGNELFKRWEYEDAVKEYKNAIKLNPNTLLAMNAQYCIGQTWYRAGKYEEAFATLTNLIETHPNSTIAPVTELMLSQVQYAMENDQQRQAAAYSGEDVLMDPETGIRFNRKKTLAGESDIITYANDLNISPNGKFLLFGNWVVPMDGTKPFELIDFSTNGLHVTRGTWSPDGTAVAFFTGDGLCVVPVSAETGHVAGPYHEIVDATLQYQTNPQWSPDGSKITYQGPEADLWVVGADGSDLRQITNTAIREIGPAWSPDGKIIAYGTTGNTLELYHTDNNSFTKQAETDYRCFPVWSPDGKWIIGDHFGELHFYRLEQKTDLEFTPPKEAGTFFSWSNDGSKMLFFRTSYFDDSGLKIASPDGGPSNEPVPLLTNWWTVRWSEDSKYIAVQGEDDQGEIAVRIVPLSGGNSNIIELNELPAGKLFPFNISSNIEKILCSIKTEEGKIDLYVVPISASEAKATGTPVKVFTANEQENPYRLSPDGEKLALIYQGNIWIVHTNGTGASQITDNEEEVGYVEWTPDGKSLLFNTPSDGWCLMKHPGPEAETIQLLDGKNKIECSFWDIDVAPDYSRFAFSMKDKLKIVPLDPSAPANSAV
ncbi:MAG: tetratricopeptide repeat protein [Bacteroidales bacterium]